MMFETLTAGDDAIDEDPFASILLALRFPGALVLRQFNVLLVF